MQNQNINSELDESAMKINHYSSAVAMAKAIRDGSMTSRELVKMHVDRIERFDGEINAVIQRDFEEAFRQADKADQLVSQWRHGGGQELPMFCGVPMTIKAGIPTPGFACTNGVRLPWGPKWLTCELTTRLFENCGAIVLGKTNLPYFLCDWESNNPGYGRTGNPYDLSLTPGGSSGGSAAALAAGLAPLEIGSDIGGSVRIPAACCGVVGHVATRGVVPAIDVQFGLGGCFDRFFMRQMEPKFWMGRYGPMARTAEDVIAMMDVLGGEMAAALPKPKSDSRLSNYRVALWRTHKTCPAGKEVSHAMETAAATLKAAGATVEELELPMDPMETYRIYLINLSTFLTDHMTKEQKENTKAGRPDDSYPADIQSPFADMDRASVNGIPEGTKEACENAFNVWNEHLKQYDAVLLPITPCKAWKTESGPSDMLAQASVLRRTLAVDGEDRYYGEGLFWAHLSVLFGLPATGFPVEFSSDGIPVGIQALGARGNDYLVLDVVKQLMAELGRDVFRAPAGFE